MYGTLKSGGIRCAMPIPPFDGILNVLPPHLGDPRKSGDCSPYHCRIGELCSRFATSSLRKQLLNKLLAFRSEILRRNIAGFQWFGGSFLEDIECQEGRDPKDIDVVTFVTNPKSPNDLGDLLVTGGSSLLDWDYVKQTYSLDHYWISLGSNPIRIVSNARYWYGLFSHRRDRLWKGMVVSPLLENSDDSDARSQLGSMP